MATRIEAAVENGADSAPAGRLRFFVSDSCLRLLDWTDMPSFPRRDLLAVILSLLAFGGGSAIYFSLREDRPLIGISHTLDPDYAAAVVRAGGRPVTLLHDVEKIPEHLERLDGLVLPGGRDIPPWTYGEEAHPTVVTVSEERFQFESTLAKAWIRDTDKPALGVCLGCQLLNVVQGGTLIQDIPSELGTNHRGGRHPVTLDSDSLLYRLFRRETLVVNSRHHQSIDKPGEGIRIAGRSPDGVVEAIELVGKAFVVGVQWHPESMAKDPLQQRLYGELVRQAILARKNKASRPPKPPGITLEKPE